MRPPPGPPRRPPPPAREARPSGLGPPRLGPPPPRPHWLPPPPPARPRRAPIGCRRRRLPAPAAPPLAAAAAACPPPPRPYWLPPPPPPCSRDLPATPRPARPAPPLAAAAGLPVLAGSPAGGAPRCRRERRAGGSAFPAALFTRNGAWRSQASSPRRGNVGPCWPRTLPALQADLLLGAPGRRLSAGARLTPGADGSGLCAALCAVDGERHPWPPPGAGRRFHARSPGWQPRCRQAFPVVPAKGRCPGSQAHSLCPCHTDGFPPPFGAQASTPRKRFATVPSKSSCNSDRRVREWNSVRKNWPSAASDVGPTAE